MQNIRSIHQFILEKEQILQSNDLGPHPIFNHTHPKITKTTFMNSFMNNVLKTTFKN